MYSNKQFTGVEISINSVMQSDWNIFGCYIVLDSINMAFKDDDSILDQLYEGF